MNIACAWIGEKGQAPASALLAIWCSFQKGFMIVQSNIREKERERVSKSKRERERERPCGIDSIESDCNFFGNLLMTAAVAAFSINTYIIYI